MKRTIQSLKMINLTLDKGVYGLYGSNGSGKTSLIKGLASYLKYNLYMLNFNKDLDDTKMMNAIKKVKSNSILVMEDIDCLFDHYYLRNKV